MKPLILASTSVTRQRLLQSAGIDFIVAAPDIDESAVKAEAKSEGASAERTAGRLADRKALAVARRFRNHAVIGADQMLDCEGAWLDKPVDRAAARRQLLLLRGRTHRLLTGIAVAADDRIAWRHVESSELTMHPFTEEFLDRYLDQAGEAVYSSVGGYQLEGLGVQLFSKVSGDFFCILGLPLLQLLAYLRETAAIPS